MSIATVTPGGSTIGEGGIPLEAVLRGRRSVRDFTPEPVGEETIRELIDAAVRAPSASNRQPWSFTVVLDRALLDRLSEAAKAYLVASDPERYGRLADPARHLFHHAPALVLISGAVADPWAVEDCAVAAQNLMLAAAARGLGTCWIGYAQRYLETAEGQRLLALPADFVHVAPLVVGHPASVPELTERGAPEIRWLW